MLGRLLPGFVFWDLGIICCWGWSLGSLGLGSGGSYSTCAQILSRGADSEGGQQMRILITFHRFAASAGLETYFMAVV